MMSDKRRATLATSIVAIGAAGSLEREDQKHSLIALAEVIDQNDPTCPCPPGFSIGDERWCHWLMTREEGTMIHA
jgi:hypothetical protein